MLLNKVNTTGYKRTTPLGKLISKFVNYRVPGKLRQK